MNVIHKFLFHIEMGDQTIAIPENAQILSVQMKQSALTLWALTDLDKSIEHRTFFVVGTGSPFDATNTIHRGTVQDRGFVWHLFERVEPKA